MLIGVLVAVVAGFDFGLRLLVVAVFAVVDGLQEARLILLHHVSGGAAAGQRSRTFLKQLLTTMNDKNPQTCENKAMETATDFIQNDIFLYCRSTLTF